MPLLEMNHTFDEEKSMKVRMSSAHGHAQSMAIVEAIMGLRLQTLSIPVICVALNAKEDQRNISQQLIEGEINLDYFNACMLAQVFLIVIVFKTMEYNKVPAIYTCRTIIILLCL